MVKCREQRVVSCWKRRYSYEDMCIDIHRLSARYAEILRVQILTQTLDGRNVYCLCLGNREAGQCVLVDAALHGREWLNTQLLMYILEKCCRGYRTERYHGRRYCDLLEQVCVYLLPMMNPDGVTISQFGLKKIIRPEWRKQIQSICGEEVLSRWKANVRGVDLNRNYDSHFWDNPVRLPSSAEYGGEYPLSEPESAALVRLVQQIHPAAVINYHEAGGLIYYTRPSLTLSVVHCLTGYPVEWEIQGSPGCFGDWLEQEGIDYCTVETCCGKAPVGHWQWYPVYWRNRNVLLALADALAE